MRRLTCGAVLAVALAACGDGPAEQGLSIRVDSNPFRLTLVDNGKTVVAQDKGARFRYQLRSNGYQYSLTKVDRKSVV